MKIPQYLKPIATIFILAAGTGIISFVAFGVYGPSPYLLPQVEDIVEEIVVEIPSGVPIFEISILEGSSEQGNPDYEPDEARVPKGNVIKWTNDDLLVHTVTSSIDFGETFDSGLLNQGEEFLLSTDDLEIGAYEYMCIVHPWMVSTLVVEEPT